MTYYLLANPNSGAGKGARTLETLIPYLEKNNYEYRLFKTKAAGEEGALVRQILDLKNPDDHLVIIGGDGTIQECSFIQSFKVRNIHQSTWKDIS